MKFKSIKAKNFLNLLSHPFSVVMGILQVVLLVVKGIFPVVSWWLVLIPLFFYAIILVLAFILVVLIFRGIK